MKKEEFFSLQTYQTFSLKEMMIHSRQFLSEMEKRRSIREFSSQSFPRKVIENCLLVASSAPSGANRQPWKFVVVSNPVIKKEIRREAEKREQRFYQDISTKNWVKDLELLGTNASKPFLEVAPYLIVIFAERYSWSENKVKQMNYYVPESVGIATGMLITAIHHTGLACLTYTPPRIGFFKPVTKQTFQ